MMIWISKKRKMHRDHAKSQAADGGIHTANLILAFNDGATFNCSLRTVTTPILGAEFTQERAETDKALGVSGCKTLRFAKPKH